MTKPEIRLTPRQLSLAMTTLKTAMDRMAKAQKALRETATKDLLPKERHVAVHPVTGEALGYITHSDPDPKATVTDRNALMPWIQDHNPDGLRDVTYVDGKDEEVLAALRQYAPHLLQSTVEIAPWAEAEAEREAVRAYNEGDPPIPGIVVEKPEGTVIAYPNAKKFEQFVDVIRGGFVGVDGAVPALPPGGDAA